MTTSSSRKHAEGFVMHTVQVETPGHTDLVVGGQRQVVALVPVVLAPPPGDGRADRAQRELQRQQHRHLQVQEPRVRPCSVHSIEVQVHSLCFLATLGQYLEVCMDKEQRAVLLALHRLTDNNTANWLNVSKRRGLQGAHIRVSFSESLYPPDTYWL